MNETSYEKSAADPVLYDIATYAASDLATGDATRATARLCLMDALGCALAALDSPGCVNLLGPIIPDVVTPHGAKVPGTQFQLDPVTAAFNIGAMIRWLDFNDTWLAAEWGHPSDNLGAILAVADWKCRERQRNGLPALTMKDVLIGLIKAYEIQGIVGLDNAFNRLGYDHVLVTRVASTAVAAWLGGAAQGTVLDAVSNAWIDGPALRNFRHAPETGSRKSWAAADATSRGVQLALWALRGEMGYPHALSTKRWGFYDTFYKGEQFVFSQGFGSYIVENILFKVSFPAEFHAQTAVEAAITLHPSVRHRLNEIEKIVITTQATALGVIDKKGPLRNPADRDHCMQYMVAVALLKGNITSEDYEDSAAANPLIDALREKMFCVENKQWTLDHDDPAKRSISNGVQVFFRNGSKTDFVSVEYPLGHRSRRQEALPLIKAKFIQNAASRLPGEKLEAMVSLFADASRFEAMPVSQFIDMLCI